jgi:hypothetical protein
MTRAEAEGVFPGECLAAAADGVGRAFFEFDPGHFEDCV